MKASVKIMRSYDYNHFEISLSTEEDLTIDQVDSMRKEAARLVDKAVAQYKISKMESSKFPDQELSRQAQIIKENFPQSEWTDAQKALIKRHEDNVYWANRPYDYEDDWEEMR